MSWHYLQAGEVASWDPSCSDGVPSALSRLIPTALSRFYEDKPIVASQLSLFGMMSERLTVARGMVKLMSLPEGSRAKTLVVPVVARESPENVRACFSKCCESLKRFGLALSYRKMRRNFVPRASVLWSKDLAAWGMWDASGYWELGTSVRITGGNECGLLLPTPTGSANELSPTMQRWPGHKRMLDWLRNLPTPLASEMDRGIGVAELKRRRSPMLRVRFVEAMKTGILPATTAQLYGSNKGGAAGRNGRQRKSLESLTGGIFLALREWMMGVPIGWSALEPLETCRFQQWLRSHGRF